MLEKFLAVVVRHGRSPPKKFPEAIRYRLILASASQLFFFLSRLFKFLLHSNGIPAFSTDHISPTPEEPRIFLCQDDYSCSLLLMRQGKLDGIL